jgi:hypothetical protein
MGPGQLLQWARDSFLHFLVTRAMKTRTIIAFDGLGISLGAAALAITGGTHHKARWHRRAEGHCPGAPG